MKKTTKILTVVLAAAILFSALSVSAFAARNDDVLESERSINIYVDGVKFICTSLIVVDGCDMYVEMRVEYADDNTGTLVEPYYISIYSMVVFKKYGELETYDNLYVNSYQYSGATAPMTYQSYVLDGLTPYQYVATENFVTITNGNSSNNDVIGNGVSYFWTTNIIAPDS